MLLDLDYSVKTTIDRTHSDNKVSACKYYVALLNVWCILREPVISIGILVLSQYTCLGAC